MALDASVLAQFFYGSLLTLFQWMAALICGFYIAMSLIVAVESMFQRN